MNTKPDNGNDLAKELAARLADMEAANHALQEEVERKKRALEGFIAENEALKAELGGKATTNNNTGKETVPVEKHGGDTATETLQELTARARRLGW